MHEIIHRLAERDSLRLKQFLMIIYLVAVTAAGYFL